MMEAPLSYKEYMTWLVVLLADRLMAKELVYSYDGGTN
jgi:hypothetical protein